MDILPKIIFTKMNQELSLAEKAEDKKEQALHLYTLKLLVEICLAENKEIKSKSQANIPQSPADDPIPQISSIMDESKKSNLNDEENGTALLDF